MNIEHLVNKLVLWQDIKNFYSFNNLLVLSNKYYEGVKICFATIDYIYVFTFYGHRLVNPIKNIDKIVLTVTYNGLLFENINKPNKEKNPYFLNEYEYIKTNFTKNVKNDILQNKFLIEDKTPIIKFCLLSDLYNYIIQGVNI